MPSIIPEVQEGQTIEDAVTFPRPINASILNHFSWEDCSDHVAVKEFFKRNTLFFTEPNIYSSNKLLDVTAAGRQVRGYIRHLQVDFDYFNTWLISDLDQTLTLCSLQLSSAKLKSLSLSINPYQFNGRDLSEAILNDVIHEEAVKELITTYVLPIFPFLSAIPIVIRSADVHGRKFGSAHWDKTPDFYVGAWMVVTTPQDDGMAIRELQRPAGELDYENAVRLARLERGEVPQGGDNEAGRGLGAIGKGPFDQ